MTSTIRCCWTPSSLFLASGSEDLSLFLGGFGALIPQTCALLWLTLTCLRHCEINESNKGGIRRHRAACPSHRQETCLLLAMRSTRDLMIQCRQRSKCVEAFLCKTVQVSIWNLHNKFCSNKTGTLTQNITTVE